MFTGIVTAVGVVSDRQDTQEGMALRIDADYADLVAGESIAVNGACLTVVDPGNRQFGVQAVTSTLGRTNLGTLAPGHRVNLERAMAVGDRLGGHWVQGHVDGVGTVVALVDEPDKVLIDIRIPPDVHARTVAHGSVTVDGVSLTVNALRDENVIQVSLIPFTRSHTTLGDRAVGDQVHIEGDVLGAYVERLLAPRLHDDK